MGPQNTYTYLERILEGTEKPSLGQLPSAAEIEALTYAALTMATENIIFWGPAAKVYMAREMALKAGAKNVIANVTESETLTANIPNQPYICYR